MSIAATTSSVWAWWTEDRGIQYKCIENVPDASHGYVGNE